MARDLIKHQILWKVKGGGSMVWYDNQIGLGDLYTLCKEENTYIEDQSTVLELTDQGE